MELSIVSLMYRDGNMRKNIDEMTFQDKAIKYE